MPRSKTPRYFVITCGDDQVPYTKEELEVYLAEEEDRFEEVMYGGGIIVEGVQVSITAKKKVEIERIGEGVVNEVV